MMEPKKQPKFFMLYAQGGSAPNHIHVTYEEALNEVKRLIQNNRNMRIYILEAKELCYAQPPVLPPMITEELE